MGLEFIDRTLRTSGIVLLVFLPFGLYYLGVFPALAVFSGGVWGMLNLILISALVRATFRPEGVQTQRAIGLSLLKFPLLYVSGYFLLKVSQFEPLHLLIGFSSLLGIMVLKTLGRLMIHADDEVQNGKEVKGLS